jgi:stearoyl-CoA desaturase (delta-9 desaturase)
MQHAVALPVGRGSRAMAGLSLVLLVAMHLACLAVFVVPMSRALVALAVASYAVRMFAITAGYHRYLSHRAFKTSRTFQFLLAFVGTAAMQNGPLWWASWHRRHHAHSDTPADVHSPAQHGFWQAHLGWVLGPAQGTPDLSNVRDLTRWPELRWLNRHEWVPIVLWALACFGIAGLNGVVWGFVVSTILCFHATLCINSIAHVWGSRRYVTSDDSRNNLLLAIVTLGEGWHNNHHHDMRAARQGRLWWEVDVTYYVLRLAAALGIVWDLHPPTERRARLEPGPPPSP